MSCSWGVDYPTLHIMSTVMINIENQRLERGWIKNSKSQQGLSKYAKISMERIDIMNSCKWEYFPFGNYARVILSTLLFVNLSDLWTKIKYKEFANRSFRF